MKKILLFALPLLAMLAVSCEKDNGELSGNDIIEFKDPNFLKALLIVQEIELDDDVSYMIDVDANKDGKISVNEASKVKMLVLYDYDEENDECISFNITDISEIKYFTALEDLDCGGNELTELDLSKNTALKYLYCGDNQLTTLDVSGCTALKDLDCYNNQLTTLDLSKNTALEQCGCEQNQLTTLDLSKNSKLKQLSFYFNKVTSLNVSGCTALTYLDCNSNQLTTLDVSNNPALEYLDCWGNELTTLDLSKNTALNYLQCNDTLKKIYLNVKNNLGSHIIDEYKDIIEYVE